MNAWYASFAVVTLPSFHHPANRDGTRDAASSALPSSVATVQPSECAIDTRMCKSLCKICQVKWLQSGRQ